MVLVTLYFATKLKSLNHSKYVAIFCMQRLYWSFMPWMFSAKTWWLKACNFVLALVYQRACKTTAALGRLSFVNYFPTWGKKVKNLQSFYPILVLFIIPVSTYKIIGVVLLHKNLLKHHFLGDVSFFIIWWHFSPNGSIISFWLLISRLQQILLTYLLM